MYDDDGWHTHSPMYSQRKEPFGTKSGERTPQPFANLPLLSMHLITCEVGEERARGGQSMVIRRSRWNGLQRITSRRYFGPLCTRRFVHS